ncbi:RHS repeat-associated core domain-containing protein [Glutamicibacter sp. TV12E]|uniref:RHS repeat-associated core domain-containing protein n=1 Tax=Glutamicibacter sp. TV12E TaxID=3446362 RepID=UPI00403388F1
MKYFADDAAAAITRNGTTATISRDPAGRRQSVTSTGTNAAGTETKHYADSSDNPAWSSRKQGTQTITTRYESTIGGDLALTITDNNVELALSNPHGDVVATVPVTGTGAGQGITGWAQYDEYGNQPSEPVNTGATSYGWHGADQRAVDTSGLILMGARLYNSVNRLFTSRDPVQGGNSTSYAYLQDPVGMSDITGLWNWGKALGIASTISGFIPGPAGIISSAAFGYSSAIAYRLSGNRAAARRMAISTTIGLVVPKYASAFTKLRKIKKVRRIGKRTVTTRRTVSIRRGHAITKKNYKRMKRVDTVRMNAYKFAYNRDHYVNRYRYYKRKYYR